ncbi:WD40 repeat-like protein [Metschnikowia bicuspidata]|uniref:ASTRA-associated protein 1 n=1 Tax=Metschnikowia bicuspidata TaxID=27322 RepID=A0A4P9Z9F6_9ASCO|nr:WD40 repeat-like protein [Metschnikowia bicuspidata]
MSSAALRLSLRGHKAAVACITQKNDFLVSADRDGWVIVWNLATKRPRAIWKAHEGHIVTLKLTAMGLLTHGRDLHIRFWKDPPMPQCEEFPVNSLNFCNVDLVSLDLEAALLVTPATVDSDNFDVYKIRSNGATVLRVVENFSVKAATTSKSEVEEINSPELVLQLRGNGVIMRLLFVAQNLLFVGYESGAVFCFRIDPDVRDRTKTLSGHTPLPVLSLEYDPCRHELYCGSASKKLLRISTKRLEDLSENGVETPCNEECDSRPRSHYGLQNIHVTESGFVVAFWDGVIKSFTTDCEPKLVLERAEETIQALKFESIGGPTKKSLCLYAYTPGDMIQGERRALSVRDRSPKEPLLFVGYGDGLIRAYKPSFV